MNKFLTIKQRKELLSELKLERHRRFAERIKVILLLDEGKTYKNISKFLFLDEGSIRNYRKRYVDGGIERLVNDNYHSKKCFLNPIQIEELKVELKNKIYQSTSQIITYLKKKYKVQYSVGGVTDLLHRIGFSYKKATPVPGKANKEAQRKFINQYNGIKSHGLVFFMDSVHPEFAPTISYGWIKKGERFEVKTNSGWKKRVNICGAIEIDTHEVITRSFSTINKNSICDLLKLIRKKHPDLEKKIYIVLDQASYHRAKKVKKLARKLKIRLKYLPPYSPNLNPIERLWKFMKKKVTYNKYFEKFDDFKKSLIDFFRGIRKYKDELETLITDNFPILGT